MLLLFDYATVAWLQQFREVHRIERLSQVVEEEWCKWAIEVLALQKHFLFLDVVLRFHV
jgi:hypothetical protein